MTEAKRMPETMRRTALFEAHRALGAKLVPFGGFEMPVSYAGILREHDAVRRRAGLFDLSHMGQFALRGANVGAWAETLTVNLVANMKPGQARYNIFTNERGGAHDDVIFYRLDAERWLLVVNASNAEAMWQLVSAAAPPGIELVNNHGVDALIAIQGPRSVEILRDFVAADLAAMKYYSCLETRVRGVDSVVARTGYTGEDGFEIYIPSDEATSVRVWNEILEAGKEFGVVPCGLGARNTLRLEARLPLYGHEISDAINVWEAGLDRFCKMEKPDFIGRASLEKAKTEETKRALVGLEMIDRGIARDGYKVLNASGSEIGYVTSGSPAPFLKKNIALAYVPGEFAALGTELKVEIRGQGVKAQVVPTPFYRKPKKV